MIPIPKGYKFAVAQAGFKSPKLDLGVICSDTPATAAGVFTTNLFKAAPVLHCMETLENSTRMRAMVGNSGQANACTGQDGLVDAKVSMEMVGEALDIPMNEILPTSTGVIGPRLKLDLWKKAMPALAESFGEVGPLEFAKSIMTTDTFPKLAWKTVTIGEREVRLLGMTKGAGMISPNMATMLGYIICDAEVDAGWWREALAQAVELSFNRITVDGDTSTNDTVLAFANGAAGIKAGPQDEAELATALIDICRELARLIVQDAEGGTKVVTVRVKGACCEEDADLAARAVGTSPLVKTALFGCDANWGRIVAALGRSGATFNPDKVNVAIGGVNVFRLGRPVEGDLDSMLAPFMKRQDIVIDVSLGDGPGEFELLASDLTHEYVSINADYRS